MFEGSLSSIKNIKKSYKLEGSDVTARLDDILVKKRKMSSINAGFKKFDLNKTALINNRITLKSSKNGLCADYSLTPEFLATGEVAEGANILRIKIKPGKNGRTADFTECWKKSTLSEAEYVDDFTWHHMDDFDPVTGECTMQLVESVVHGTHSIPHVGASKQAIKFYNL